MSGFMLSSKTNLWLESDRKVAQNISSQQRNCEMGKNQGNKETKKANNLDGSEWTKYSISVWHDIRKSADEVKLGHPAMFPTMLTTRLIRCFSKSEDMNILDPFMGSGSTLVSALNLGRQGIGFEVNKEYVDIARARCIQQPFFEKYIPPRIYLESAANIPERLSGEPVHLCITSPPYWDILSQKRTADMKEIRDYGDNPDDLSRIQDYNDFLNELVKIFKAVYQVLLPGKYCLVNVMDIRKKEKLYPFHADLSSKMQAIGFILDDIIIWDRRQEYNNLRPLGYPYVFRLNRIHEYILIFQKPKKETSEGSPDSQ